MCLAVPVKILSVSEDGYSSRVDADGVQQDVNVAFIDNPEPGDYVLVHAGFAIRKWSREDYEEYRNIVGE